ncbi:hypothetical protein [Atopobium sp. oral taxon 810]|nr:hypothetical protein [Atopobium sp. oral taxon 810]ERI06201.1 hypothetical protein HMPREF9069_00371 [Atopobium sp. oral taxon 810 str. F0209]
MPYDQAEGLIYIDFGDRQLRSIDKIADIPMTIETESDADGSAS